MPCTTVNLGNGNFVITCSRGRKPKALCEVCRERPHEVLCDFQLSGAKAGKTCDRKMCRQCAAHVGHDRDMCPPHAKLAHTQAELELGAKR